MEPQPTPPPTQVEATRASVAGAVVLVTDLANKTLAVKEGETFLYSDTEGNLDDRKDFGRGLYHRDTRFLSHFMMRLSGRDPVLLSSSSERAYMAHVDLTNPDLYEGDELAVPQQTLNIRRIRAINGRLFERVRVKNYNPYPVSVDVDFSLGADFADIFEVRGMARETTGSYSPPVTEGRPMTNRDRMAIHATDKACAGCHTLVDPIGYGFEKFDAIGQRRDKLKLTFGQTFGEAKRGEQKVSTVELDLDTTGRVAGIPNSAFTSPKELGAVLAASPQCQECVVKQYFRYVSGRTETPADRPLIRSVLEDFRKADFRFKEMIISMMRAREFPGQGGARVAGNR